MAKYYFATIRGKSAGYYAAVTALAVVASFWLIGSIVRFLMGYYITGMSHSVTWSADKVIFVLFVGLSAGSLLISGLAAIFGQTQFKVLSRVAAFNSILFMVGALLILISSWGRPDRIFLPFYNINPRSLLSLNAFIYSTYITVGILYLWALIKQNDKVARALGITAVVTAIFVHSGTGFIFGIINARELFFSPITPLAFVVAALSSGTALAMLVLYFSFKFTNRQIDRRFFEFLSRVMLGLIFVVAFLVTIEHLTHLYVPEGQHAESFVMRNGGFYTFVFWVQFYLVGAIIPIVILLNKGTRNRIGWILVASACHVVGVLGERILFILPGQVLAIPLMPGYELTSPFLDGVNVSYYPRLVEWAQIIGIFGLLALIYMLAIRILPLLPVQADYIAPAAAHAEEEATEEEEEAAEEPEGAGPAPAEEEE
ncbi:MAG: hypothetical protein C4534_01085 [Gaiellales bacterium]|nr:MAG: hypothetical protein C4534_01085 [Gaiellales bacterium]